MKIMKHCECDYNGVNHLPTGAEIRPSRSIHNITCFNLVVVEYAMHVPKQLAKRHLTTNPQATFLVWLHRAFYGEGLNMMQHEKICKKTWMNLGSLEIIEDMSTI